jgi:hypothetical protein
MDSAVLRRLYTNCRNSTAWTTSGHCLDNATVLQRLYIKRASTQTPHRWQRLRQRLQTNGAPTLRRCLAPGNDAEMRTSGVNGSSAGSGRQLVQIRLRCETHSGRSG